MTIGPFGSLAALLPISRQSSGLFLSIGTAVIVINVCLSEPATSALEDRSDKLPATVSSGVDASGDDSLKLVMAVTTVRGWSVWTVSKSAKVADLLH